MIAEYQMTKIKVKVKVAVYDPVIYYYVCSTDFTNPLRRWVQIQLGHIDTIDLGYVHQVPIMAIQY